MAQRNSEQLLKETDAYLNESMYAETEAETLLPFETLDGYSTDPIGFGDVTAKLMEKVSAVFDLAVKYNRHSSDYLKSCAQLEKGIKYLGSSCVLKFALEQKNHVFPKLEQLNTTNLYIMASIHFQKIDRALTEYINEKQAVDDDLLDMEYRYYHLLERLRSTEVKLRNYNNRLFCGNEDYELIVHGLAFSDKSWTKDIHKNDKSPAFQRAKAFSAKSEFIDLKSEIEMNPEVRDAAACIQKLPLPQTEEMQQGQFSCAASQKTAAGGMSEKDIPVCSQIPEQTAMRCSSSDPEQISRNEDEIKRSACELAAAQFEPQAAASICRTPAGHDSG